MGRLYNYSDEEKVALVSDEVAAMTPQEMVAFWDARGWPERGWETLARQRTRYRKRAGLPVLDNRARERAWTPPGGAPIGRYHDAQSTVPNRETYPTDYGDPATSAEETSPWDFGDLLGDETREEMRSAVSPVMPQDARQRAPAPRPAPGPVLDPDADEEPIEDLIARRRERFIKERRRHERKIHTIAVPSGPFGVVWFGDPHLDSPSCDWDELLAAIDVVNRTDGMRAACVGDTRNNWVGNLIVNYAKQEATDGQSVRLARWFARACPWDVQVLGNHDLWRDGKMLAKEVFRGAPIRIFEPYEARVIYRWPDGTEYRAEVRHDFKGRSMWNPTHGGGKEAKLDPWADLYVSGHLHTPAVHEEEGPDNRWRVVLLLSSFDGWAGDYAQRMQLRHRDHGSTITTILDPAANPADRCRRFMDPAEGAEFLEWLRSR